MRYAGELGNCNWSTDTEVGVSSPGGSCRLSVAARKDGNLRVTLGLCFWCAACYSWSSLLHHTGDTGRCTMKKPLKTRVYIKDIEKTTAVISLLIKWGIPLLANCRVFFFANTLRYRTRKRSSTKLFYFITLVNSLTSVLNCSLASNFKEYVGKKC